MAKLIKVLYNKNLIKDRILELTLEEQAKITTYLIILNPKNLSIQQNFHMIKYQLLSITLLHIKINSKF